MPEDIVKAKIVFDTSGVSGSLGSGSSGGKSGGGMGLGKLATGVGLGVGALQGIKKGVGMLVESSPQLQATLKIFKKGLMLVLRPMADVISLWLRPFLMQFLQFGMKFYKDYKSGGFWVAFKKVFEDIDIGKLIATGLELALVLSIAKAGIGLLGTALGGLAVSGDSLLLPLIILVAGYELGKAMGLDSFTSLLAGALGVAVGSILVATGLATAGTAFTIGLAVMISFLVGSWIGEKLADLVKKWIGEDKAQGAIKFVGGILQIPFNFVEAIKNIKEGASLFMGKDAKNKANEKSATDVYAQAVNNPGGSKTIGEIYAGNFEEAGIEIEKIGKATDEVKEKTSLWGTVFKWAISAPFNALHTTMFIGHSPPLVDFPKELAKNTMKYMPIMHRAFKDVFEEKLLNMFSRTITEVRILYDEISTLQRTVTTTHIIRTIHEDD